MVAGAPFRKRLPDREIDLYPIRYFTAILNPRADLILHTQPPTISDPSELWTSRTDGSEQRELPDIEPAPPLLAFAGMSWSKDGEWVVYARGRIGMRIDQMDADVWKMQSDGSALQNLTVNSPGFDGYPSFSGDGKEIVFVSARDGSLDLYVMKADGSDVRRLTNDHAMNLFPSFSPSSNQIAFVSNRDNPKSYMFDVYLFDLDADGAPGMIHRDYARRGPAWTHTILLRRKVADLRV
jgi:hypothetical protein